MLKVSHARRCTVRLQWEGGDPSQNGNDWTRSIINGDQLLKVLDRGQHLVPVWELVQNHEQDDQFIESVAVITKSDHQKLEGLPELGKAAVLKTTIHLKMDVQTQKGVCLKEGWLVSAHKLQGGDIVVKVHWARSLKVLLHGVLPPLNSTPCILMSTHPAALQKMLFHHAHHHTSQ